MHAFFSMWHPLVLLSEAIGYMFLANSVDGGLHPMQFEMTAEFRRLMGLL
jgi:hypothetical protein